MRKILILLLLVSFTSLTAQEMMKENTEAAKTIDGIVKEMLRIISGEAGKKRNLKALENLFLESARFTVHMHSDSGMTVETVSLPEFIELMKDSYYEQFSEVELNKTVDEYNDIAQVFQVYHAKDVEGEEETGINSYQLVRFDGRWWIVNILWTGDSNGVKVPEKYLKK